MQKIIKLKFSNFCFERKIILKSCLIFVFLWIIGISGTTVNNASANMGTDSAGVYRWGDNTEEFCSFDWIMPSGATQIDLSNGTLSDSIPIGFDFPYYYESYTSIKVFSGGFIVFEPLTTYDSTEIGLIPQDSPAGIIAGLWDDLDPGTEGTISYATMGTSGDRFFVVTFTGVPSLNTGENVTFQIILYEGSGNISINIENFGSVFGGAVGISDPHGVAGRQFYGPQSTVSPFSAICLSYQSNYLDPDGDMLPYFSDNCPLADNINQEDIDGDDIGDACDICPEDPENDIDGDSICGNIDNCPTVPNSSQEDADEDGVGDACDPCPDTDDVDTDGDEICDLEDNCPSVSNSSQEDTDEDGIGDACDLCPLDSDNDVDEDGVCGDVDNCPEVANSDQLDTDGDNKGDLCDDTDEPGNDDSGCSCKVYSQSNNSAPWLLLVLISFIGLKIRKRFK